MRKSFIIISLLTFFCLTLAGIILYSQENSGNADVEYVSDIADETTMNWAQKVLRVKGNGFGPEKVKELGRRKILAKRAAKMDAYRNLIEVIKGVYVTSNTRVEDMMLENDSISAKTEGMLKGMRVVDVVYSNDGGCEISVEVNINKQGGFLLSALSNQDINVQDEYPKFDWVAMRNELEGTKMELAKTKSNLSHTKKELNSTKYALSNSKKELKKIKGEYAVLEKDFTKVQTDLIATSNNLILTEEKLKNSNEDNIRLEDLFASTNSELKNTKKIVENLSDSLIQTKMDLAVNNKELELTKHYLSEKRRELGNLAADFNNYEERYKKNEIEKAVLVGYVQRIREVQVGMENRMNCFFYPEKSDRKMNQDYSQINYTGLLIDARGMNLKPILAPAILNQKKEKLYGIGVIPTSLNGGAIVDYLSGDLDHAKMYPKIGQEPLIIKAEEVVKQSDIIISDEDAKKLALIIKKLEQQKVAILL